MCNHPSIVKLHSSFGTKNKLIFVLDYFSNGDLDLLLKKYGTLPLDLCKQYSAEIINVLEYMHNSLNLCHRDLKPSNIMIDSNYHLKLVN